MMHRQRRISAIAAAVLTVVCGAALVAGAGGAGAATKAKSTVFITSGKGTAFKGKVTSPVAACRKGRKVKLYRDTRLAARAGVVGTDTTDATGAWVIHGNFLSANYYASVAALTVHSHGKTYNCGFDVSVQHKF